MEVGNRRMNQSRGLRAAGGGTMIRSMRLGPMIAAMAWCAVTCCALEQQAGGDWPQFLGPERSGIAGPVKLAERWPEGGPPAVWRRQVGQGFAGPVVGGGTLVLFHRVGDEEVVEGLEARSGKELWKAKYPTDYRDDFGFDEGPRATPTIHGGRVYTLGAAGVLSCWELEGGRKVWQVDTRAEYGAGKGFFGMACSPRVEGKGVIVNIGGRDGAGVVALDRETGTLLWKATEEEASYSSPIAATFGGKRYVLVFNREGLAAIEPVGGKVLWKMEWRSRNDASVNAATPVVVGDLIFLSASYETGAVVLRFKEGGPEKVWESDEVMSNHYSTSVHREGFLYGFHGRQETGQELRCVELGTGKVRWKQRGMGAGTVMVVGSELLVLTEKGELVRVEASAEGFKEKERAQVVGFGCRAYAALAGGLYFARDKQRIVCLDLSRSQ